MKEKLSIFAKERLPFIISVSLALSVWVICVIVNFGDGDETLSAINIVLTVLYLAVFVGLMAFAVIFPCRNALIFTRIWFIVSLVSCLFCFVSSLASLSTAGAIGFISYLSVLLFLSPLYGFYIFGGGSVTVSAIGLCISCVMCFVPALIHYLNNRHKLKRQLK